jgi:hypothetical protein
MRKRKKRIDETWIRCSIMKRGIYLHNVMHCISMNRFRSQSTCNKHATPTVSRLQPPSTKYIVPSHTNIFFKVNPCCCEWLPAVRVTPGLDLHLFSLSFLFSPNCQVRSLALGLAKEKKISLCAFLPQAGQGRGPIHPCHPVNQPHFFLRGLLWAWAAVGRARETRRERPSFGRQRGGPFSHGG